MNERIKELIAESTWVQFAEGVGHKEIFDKKKFAELIIKEILSYAEDDGDLDFMKFMVKQNFGIDYSGEQK